MRKQRGNATIVGLSQLTILVSLTGLLYSQYESRKALLLHQAQIYFCLQDFMQNHHGHACSSLKMRQEDQCLYLDESGDLALCYQIYQGEKQRTIVAKGFWKGWSGSSLFPLSSCTAKKG